MNIPNRNGGVEENAFEAELSNIQEPGTDPVETAKKFFYSEINREAFVAYLLPLILSFGLGYFVRNADATQHLDAPTLNTIPSISTTTPESMDLNDLLMHVEQLTAQLSLIESNLPETIIQNPTEHIKTRMSLSKKAIVVPVTGNTPIEIIDIKSNTSTALMPGANLILIPSDAPNFFLSGEQFSVHDLNPIGILPEEDRARILANTLGMMISAAPDLTWTQYEVDEAGQLYSQQAIPLGFDAPPEEDPTIKSVLDFFKP